MSSPMTVTDAKNQGQSAQAPKRFYETVPVYAKADDETRKEMDKLIEPFDYYDIESALNFGLDATQEVNAVSKRINAKAAAGNELQVALASVQTAMEGLSLEVIQEKALTLANSAVRFIGKNGAATAGAVGAGLLIGWPAAAAAWLGISIGKKMNNASGKVGAQFRRMTGAESTVEDETKNAEALRDLLRTEFLKINTIKTDLAKAGKLIPGNVQDIKEMGMAQVIAFSNLSLAIGAGEEIRRRFDEEVIPKEKDQFRRESLATNRKIFENALCDLTGSRASQLIRVGVLEKMKGIYAQAAQSIRYHETRSEQEWGNIIANGHIVADCYDIIAVDARANRQSSVMMGQLLTLNKTMEVLSQKSAEQGTHSLTEITHMVETIAEETHQATLVLTDRRSAIEGHRVKLIAATDNLREKFTANVAAHAQHRLGMDGVESRSLFIENENMPEPEAPAAHGPV